MLGQVPREHAVVDRRVLLLCGIAIGLGCAATGIARLLVLLISVITNLSFFGRWSAVEASPATNQLGLFVIVIPIVGAFIVGLMARYGSKAIRGHGIPEAMEQILVNQSRIPPRMTLLKPLSAAISIGTGGPFGAEGPIIATGGALGSAVGQWLPMTTSERKTLLAAGAAAGMSAIFGSPVSAVLLAVELLLFEFRPRSTIPVALASVTAAGLRLSLVGPDPVFPMPHLQPPGVAALVLYILLGALMGVAATLVTRAVYAIEDAFERLPVHWMWWPAIGAIAVGVVGYYEPRTLGVGYENISDVISNRLPIGVVALLCLLKFVSWSISLGSGTSGGTLAPLFTIGGGLGAICGTAAVVIAPAAGVDVRIAALVGMAALFSGASRALLASAVFAFETTLEPLGLLPLLGGCAASYLVACLLMKNSIMTEKIARRGIHTPAEYVADPLAHISVSEIASPQVMTLRACQTVSEVRAWMNSGQSGSSHQGFPVVDEDAILKGVVTRRDVLGAAVDPNSTLQDLLMPLPRFVYEDSTVRQAADHLVNHNIGRLPVVRRGEVGRVVGIVTRSDILSAYRRRIEEMQVFPIVAVSSVAQINLESARSGQ